MASKKALTASFVKDNAVPSPSLHRAASLHSGQHFSATLWLGKDCHSEDMQGVLRPCPGPSLGECCCFLWTSLPLGYTCRPFHDQWFQRATLWSHHQGLLPALPLAGFWIVGKSSNLGASVSPSVKIGIIRNRPHRIMVNINLNQPGAWPGA